MYQHARQRLLETPVPMASPFVAISLATLFVCVSGPAVVSALKRDRPAITTGRVRAAAWLGSASWLGLVLSSASCAIDASPNGHPGTVVWPLATVLGLVLAFVHTAIYKQWLRGVTLRMLTGASSSSSSSAPAAAAAVADFPYGWDFSAAKKDITRSRRRQPKGRQSAPSAPSSSLITALLRDVFGGWDSESLMCEHAAAKRRGMSVVETDTPMTGGDTVSQPQQGWAVVESQVLHRLLVTSAVYVLTSGFWGVVIGAVSADGSGQWMEVIALLAAIPLSNIAAVELTVSLVPIALQMLVFGAVFGAVTQ